MAKIPKLAITRASYVGNVRTHLFKINVTAEESMFKVIEEKDKKSTFTKDFVSVEFACLGCHGDQDKAWALQSAKRFHKRHMSK